MKEKLIKLLRVRHYINIERFKKICTDNNLEYRKLWEEFNQSYMYFLCEAPECIINALISLDEHIQNDNILQVVFKKNDCFKKIIFEDNTTQEINISTVEGLEELILLYKTKPVKYLLPLTDVLSEKIKTNIYEGDIIKCWDEWHNKTSIFIAYLDKQYINPDPYYVELLYTEKYGYLNGENEPNKDNEAIRFDKSLFNVKDIPLNYHCITLTKSWEVIGNIFVDYSILKPL